MRSNLDVCLIQNRQQRRQKVIRFDDGGYMKCERPRVAQPLMMAARDNRLGSQMTFAAKRMQQDEIGKIKRGKTKQAVLFEQQVSAISFWFILKL